MILGSIWGPWRGTLGVILEAGSQIGVIMLFFCDFSGLGKRSENGAPQGGGHAIRSRRRMFREGRPLSTWLHFRLRFGIVLGARIATILPLGRPGGQQGPPRGVFLFRRFFDGF